MEEEKIGREQVFELKAKEIANIDLKFSQALESEILVKKKKMNRLTIIYI